MRMLRVPAHVHWAEDQRGCVTLLNERTGQWHMLNPTASYAWRMAREDVMDTDVLATLVERFPDAPEDAIKADFERLLEDLSRRGLLEIKAVGGPEDTWSETAMMLQSGSPVPVGLRRLTAAAVAFPVAVVLTRLPFRWTARLVRLVKRRLPFPDATVGEVEALAQAAHLVARGHPGRVACYEHSLTVLVAAVLSGRSVDLHLGTASDPRRFHAWIETHGHVVSSDRDACLGEAYQRVFQL